MAVLSQLVHPDHYRPCEWDLRADAAGRTYWDALFRWHLDDVLLPLIAAEYAPAAEQLTEFRQAYLAAFDDLQAQPERHERVDILLFTEQRRRVCERYGFADPFRGVKQRENDAALELLPRVLAELDGAPPLVRQDLLLSGLMAGNIFDLGARATVQSHRDGSAGFGQARAAQAQRRWLRNDAAGWWRRWADGPQYRHVLFFVDNAGSDLVLGCLPLVRWMVQHGARVTLAANTSPALNDMTAAELGPLLGRCAELDAILAAAVQDGRLSAKATGGNLPLLDLTRLAADLVAATGDADLIVLLGMGRAVESNYQARFRCDVAWAALLKDEAVAGRLNGKLFDCVFRFEPGVA
jgi:type II pantothenate kinase